MRQSQCKAWKQNLEARMLRRANPLRGIYRSLFFDRRMPAAAQAGTVSSRQYQLLHHWIFSASVDNDNLTPTAALLFLCLSPPPERPISNAFLQISRQEYWCCGL